jgi:8-hydroxy-5-deazaflavin:NADPH oxidoreductase
VPLHAFRDVPAAPLAGKTVIDTNNYYPERDGQIAELDEGSVTSSELLQRHLPQSHVVKAFNNIFYKHLESLPRPAGAPDRSALIITGDDEQAKKDATAFLHAIGYDTVDGGTLADSWRQQAGGPIYGGTYGDFGHHAGTPISADTLAARIAETTR